MALRMLVYAGLLWQQLIREQRLHPDGRLPPILPVVLYNGDSRWRAPTKLRDLIGLPDGSPLWQWQPGLRYHLIDEGAFSAGELEGREGLPALLFRLENASDRDQLVAVADAVLAWFGSHPGFQAARTVFVEVLSAGMAPFGPDVRVPEELLEVRNMLATRVEEWKQQWKQEGLREGLQEGLQEGLREGLSKGLREGLREGEERGRQQGEERGEQRGRRQGIADLLLRQLERRFGMLPGWAIDRVQTADTVTLMEWSLLVLDAETIEAVFA
jgi:hypothetical protein